jgi:hypothetical protein
MTTITVDKPKSPPSMHPFRIQGSFSPHYAKPPTLFYADDPKAPAKVGGITATSPQKGSLSLRWSPSPNIYSPLPAGAGVTKAAFHFRHPGLSPGHHTVFVTDGKTGGSVGFGVQNAIHARVDPFR